MAAQRQRRALHGEVRAQQDGAGLTRCRLARRADRDQRGQRLPGRHGGPRYHQGPEPAVLEALREIVNIGRDFAGVDITREPIHIHPGQHYIMGGVKTDVDGQTTIAGLYAAGEVACVSVHNLPYVSPYSSDFIANSTQAPHDDLFGLPSAGFNGMDSPLAFDSIHMGDDELFSGPPGTISPKDLMMDSSVPPSGTFTDLSTPSFESPGNFSQNTSPMFTDMDLAGHEEWPSLFDGSEHMNAFDVASLDVAAVLAAEQPKKPSLRVSVAPSSPASPALKRLLPLGRRLSLPLAVSSTRASLEFAPARARTSLPLSSTPTTPSLPSVPVTPRPRASLVPRRWSARPFLSAASRSSRTSLPLVTMRLPNSKLNSKSKTPSSDHDACFPFHNMFACFLSFRLWFMPTRLGFCGGRG